MINFYRFLYIEQHKVLLPSNVVFIRVPKFGGGEEQVGKTVQQMADELEYVVLLQGDFYILYDNYQKYQVYRDKNLNNVIKEIVDSYKKYKMGIFKRRVTAFGA